MVLVSLQQDFLPTDTASSLSVSPEVSLTLVLGAVLMVIGIVVFVSFSSFAVRRVRKDITLFFLGVLMACVGFGIAFSDVTGQVESEEAAIEDARVADVEGFVSNIESVYDVQVVLPEGVSQEVSPDEPREVRVVQDGITYEAVVVQDPDSYEPSLDIVSSSDVEGEELRKR